MSEDEPTPVTSELVQEFIQKVQARLDWLDARIQDLVVERAELTSLIKKVTDPAVDSASASVASVPPPSPHTPGTIEEAWTEPKTQTAPVEEPDGTVTYPEATPEAMRNFVYSTRGSTFTRTEFAKHFGYTNSWASASTAKGAQFLIEMLEKGVIKTVGEPMRGRSTLFEFVKPEGNGSPPKQVSSLPLDPPTATLVPTGTSGPVPGTGKKASTDSDLRELLSKATPRPTLESLPNGHRYLRATGCSRVVISNSPSDPNWLHQVRRDMINAGYKFPG